MAVIQNFTVDQGSSLQVTFTLKNPDGSLFDLTGCTAELMVRQTYPAQTLIDASTANGKLVIATPTSGVIVWNIVPTDTPETIKFAQTTDDTVDFIYDMKVTTGTGEVYTPVEGTLTVNRAVTHA